MINVRPFRAPYHIYADSYTAYLYNTCINTPVMRFLKFNFSHPFKGRANLIQLNTAAPKNQTILIDNDGLLEIPISACQTGKWKLVLDWQYEDSTFCFQENFEVSHHLGYNSLIKC